MNLFNYNPNNQYFNPEAPLAARMRPQTLDEFIGQEEILQPGKPLRQAIENDILPSLIFYGPPGSGKTSLAQIISRKTRSNFKIVSSVSSGVKELRETIDYAKDQQIYYNKKTIVFIDEIHHLNKSQQDVLLSAVEDGVLTLIGATTENPYFSINSALLSRLRIFQFRPLIADEIKMVIKRSIENQERGLGQYAIKITEKALNHLANTANGDARTALSALELAVMTTTPQEGIRSITVESIKNALQQRMLSYDQHGDQHYDVISAFIKSIRGSDTDAALYWLALMICGGENPRFIARRLIILASEDIGLADPQAMLIAQAAASAVEWVGMPEARIPLAEATIYLSLAPKSNSVYLAIEKALSDVQNKTVPPVPSHLKNAHYPGAKTIGNGKGYLYPHDYPGHYVKQPYLPKSLQSRKYYQPSNQGWEKNKTRI